VVAATQLPGLGCIEKRRGLDHDSAFHIQGFFFSHD
jgi:hypothetical protein